MATQHAPAPVAPALPGPAPRILLIKAPYYRQVIEGMQAAALELFAQAAAEVEQIEVAGAYELPQALALAAHAGFDGFVLLGCVVRGETDHYEFICDSVLHGILRVATTHRLATGTAVLTVDTLAQAMARSHETGANKGAEAAAACLGQIALKRRFGA
ncbi:6,7-dimethyl-8-ribityllumazine synthase [Acidocella sp.]|uniref:6,7-dimethyl-8-ribityllumazine synthase n=1 Tax=Acidocella sp. TaxID=50710 RepID=UPI002602CEB9|nr:6,7-dimethyl-8-ribityllumazine synthase [Acidocella sp.]